MPEEPVDADDVLEVGTTGDPAALQARLREVWGGPLCVVQRERTLAELLAVQDELLSSSAVLAELGLESLGGGTSQSEGTVQLSVVTADDEAQGALDARYGVGVVELVPALRPRDGG